MKSPSDYHIEYDFVPGRVDGAWTATVPDLAGCEAIGGTAVEAEANARAAIMNWLDEARRTGRQIPTPFGKTEYGG